ncbi:MAG: DUF5671 domain-containing protein [Candidatus Limnocylindria bacterium]
MQTARRLYVYLIAGVSLGVLVAGLSMLLGVLFERLGIDAGAFNGQTTGERLTLATALVAVSLPVWLIHWFLAERSVRPDQTNAAVERTSSVRGLYIALALGALLGVAASGVGTVIQDAVPRIAGFDRFTGSDIAGALARAVVAGVAWLYHVYIRSRDWARGPMTGGGAWLPRVYLYVAAFAGLFFLLTGIAGLVETAWPSTANPVLLPDDPGGRAYAVGGHSAQILIGGIVWLGHVTYAGRLVRDAGWRGDSERPARLRQAYFVAVVIASVAGTLAELSSSAERAITGLTGVSPIGLADVGAPLLAAIPFALTAWFHAGRIREEADDSGSAQRVETAGRLGLYPVALVGLAFGAFGLARLLGEAIEGLFARSPSFGDAWLSHAVADSLPMAVLGIGTWLWAWRGVAARVASDPTGEASSTIRRATLLIALAGTVLAGIGGAAVVLYRLFGGLFGIRQSGDAIAELSMPLATLVVAAGVAAYHGIALRRDQAVARGAAEGGEAAVTAAAAEGGAAVWLRLTAPADGDLQATVAGLRARLPEGYELEVTDPPTRGD